MWYEIFDSAGYRLQFTSGTVEIFYGQ